MKQIKGCFLSNNYFSRNV